MATKKVAPPIKLPAKPAPVFDCVNCGRPAVYRTINPGANVDYYCEADGRATYPDVDTYLGRIDAE